MKWYKTRDKLPADQQEVLIRCRGIVNLAHFERSDQTFLLRDGTTLSSLKETIEWMELVAPMQEHSS
jgi:hypothetical protein